MLYCDHGIVEIDNNAAKRSLRSVALGRKNFLFMGADTGGPSSTALIRKRICGMILMHIADHSINRINELLAWVVQGQLAVAAA